MIPQHTSLALYTELEGPAIGEIGVIHPMVWPLDGFQGPLDIHGHNS